MRGLLGAALIILGGGPRIAPDARNAMGVPGAQAASRYVDANSRQGGDGATQETAWRRFSDIDWALLGPGDTLHILGARCGAFYDEELVVGSSGREGSPLVISGVARGAAGGPVIDGKNRRAFGVSVRSRDHVTLRGLTVRNHAEAGITIRGARAGVRVEHNSIFSGDPGAGNARGIDARDNAGLRPLVVRANRYGTPARSGAQTDGIWSSDNDGVVFEDNVIIISNHDTMGHSDGIQSYRDRSVEIRRNWIEQANTARYHNHGAWIENTRSGGVVTFHGNVVLAPNLTGDAVVAHFMRPEWKDRGTVDIRHNTIVGGHRALYLENSPHAQVHDNLIVAAAGGHAAVLLRALPPPGAIDGNTMWSPAGTVAYLGEGNLAWEAWRALGYDRRGANRDPRLDRRGRPRVQVAAIASDIAPGAVLVPPPLIEPAFEPCPPGD